MEIFLISFVVIAIVFFAMAMGTLFGQRSIKGSCGGVNINGVKTECVCTTKCEKNKNTVQ